MQHNPTIIAVLLGLGASRLGTMEENANTTMFLHLPHRHPQNLPELEMSSHVQVRGCSAHVNRKVNRTFVDWFGVLYIFACFDFTFDLVDFSVDLSISRPYSCNALEGNWLAFFSMICYQQAHRQIAPVQDLRYIVLRTQALQCAQTERSLAQLTQRYGLMHASNPINQIPS